MDVAVEEDLWIPAPALAADQREPNASPPDLEVDDGLAFWADADADVNEDADEMLGLEVAMGDWFELAETEVK